MTRPKLTLRQQQVMDYMRAFHAENDQLPPQAVIARHFGWKSSNAAQTFADILTAKGYIEKNAVGRYRFTRTVADPLPAAGELLRLPVRDLAPARHSWGREKCS